MPVGRRRGGRIARKLEWHYTPEHGSWLNMAECELSMLARQCLNRRIPDREMLITETTAWQTQRNAAPTPWAASSPL